MPISPQKKDFERFSKNVQSFSGPQITQKAPKVAQKRTKRTFWTFLARFSVQKWAISKKVEKRPIQCFSPFFLILGHFSVPFSRILEISHLNKLLNFRRIHFFHRILEFSKSPPKSTETRPNQVKILLQDHQISPFFSSRPTKRFKSFKKGQEGHIFSSQGGQIPIIKNHQKSSEILPKGPKDGFSNFQKEPYFPPLSTGKWSKRYQKYEFPKFSKSIIKTTTRPKKEDFSEKF